MKQEGGDFRLVDDRRRSRRFRRKSKAADEGNLVPHDQLLHQLLGFGRIAASVAIDDLDLAAAGGVAVQSQIGLDALPPVVAHDGVRPRHRPDDAHFHDVLSEGMARETDKDRAQRGESQQGLQHLFLPSRFPRPWKLSRTRSFVRFRTLAYRRSPAASMEDDRKRGFRQWRPDPFEWSTSGPRKGMVPAFLCRANESQGIAS